MPESTAPKPGAGSVVTEDRAAIAGPELQRGRLPPSAISKLEELRLDAGEFRAINLATSDEIRNLIQESSEADRELHRLTRPSSGFGLPDSDSAVQHLRGRIAHNKTRLGPLQDRGARNSELANSTGTLVNNCEEWLRKRAGEFIAPWAGSLNLLRKGEKPLDGLERCRRRLRELRAEHHQVTSAPIHAASAKAKVRGYVQGLAETARPDVTGLIEDRAQGKVRWPDLSMAYVQPIYTGDLLVVPGGTVQDGLALLAWLYQDDLVAALEREVDEVADDASALSDEDRSKRQAELEKDMLAVEREEEAIFLLTKESGTPVHRRPDADPRAVLEVELQGVQS